METTILHRGYIRGYIGIMEKKIETTMKSLGFEVISAGEKISGLPSHRVRAVNSSKHPHVPRRLSHLAAELSSS